MLRTLRYLFEDYYLALMPSAIAKRQYEVAFIVHPRDESDVRRKFTVLSRLPNSAIRLITRILPPVRVSPIHQSDARNMGLIIAVPLTAAQMSSNRELARKAISQAVRVAEQYGVKSIGLGALTASFSNGGSTVTLTKKARLTTGRLFTALNVVSLARKGAAALGHNPEHAKVAIVGAAGSIASAAAQLLSYYGFKNFVLIDLSEKQARVREIEQYMRKHNPDISVAHSTSTDAAIGAEIIITATSKEGAVITKRHTKVGTVIVDDAQPSDVSAELQRDPSILVLSGGAVHTKDTTIPFDMGIKDKETVYSCLAEALILTHDREVEGSELGEFREISIERALKLERAAERLQFTTGVFQNAERVYTEEDLAIVREALSRT